MDAKELVNSFYQPLGFLFCGVSNGKMWEYAKERAIEYCDAFIKELGQLAKPEYVTFIIQYPAESAPAKTMDGYERIDYFEKLKAQIAKM